MRRAPHVVEADQLWPPKNVFQSIFFLRLYSFPYVSLFSVGWDFLRPKRAHISNQVVERRPTAVFNCVKIAAPMQGMGVGVGPPLYFVGAHLRSDYSEGSDRNGRSAYKWGNCTSALIFLVLQCPLGI